MTLTVLTRRRRLRYVANAGVLTSALMLVVSLAAALGPSQTTSAAGANSGALTVTVGTGPTAGSPLTSGGSATAFGLTPPAGAACTGDSVSGGYRVQSYMVPASVDPATLTFGLTGPAPSGTGAAFRQPLYSTSGSAWVNKTTAVTTGLLINLPIMSFAWVDTGSTTTLPPGTYNLGFACTKNAGADMDKFWNVQLTIEAAPTDVPSGLTWALPTVTPTTTTSTTTTTTVAGAATTTTIGSGSTTTTVASGSTTTSSTIVGGGSSTTLNVNTTLFGSNAGSGGGRTIVATGSSPIPIAVWAVLLLVFGRMALLLGRPLRVLPAKSR